MAGRSAALVRFARRERFDLAVAHGSTDQPLAARAAGTPQVTMFDYEYAKVMHHWNGRLATRVLVPSAIPEEALAPYGMRPPKLVRYPGLKEEYYLADHAIDDGRARRARPRPDPADRRRAAAPGGDALPPRRLDRPLRRGRWSACLAAAPEVQTVVLPRTDEQRAALVGGAAIVPAQAIDGPSLVAAADLVVSAGGTMNREAAALGVPAYTPFAARLGAVDRAPDRRGAPAPPRARPRTSCWSAAAATPRRPCATPKYYWT